MKKEEEEELYLMISHRQKTKATARIELSI